MSLFASNNQGDVWSIGGISFASSICDILDGDKFTLEELLEEDELIQEVKSKNKKLIDFLSTEESIDQLVKYMVTPVDEISDNDLRRYKYPYISCEVFCCEVQEILDALVELHDGKYLSKLFSVLDSDKPIDPHLGGYFEKVLEMLFRRMTEYIFPFVNNGGIELLEKFLSKIDNYSIMQIIQRLMLPHIPFLMSCETDDENLLEGKESTSYQCNWSTIPEACDLLCNCMLSAKNGDVASHVSDLLITVLQLSPPDASILYHLCSGECLNSLLSAVFTIDCDQMSLDESMSTNASVSLAALAVLESLISRICEGTTSDLAEKESFSGDVENIHKVNESIVNVVSAVIPYLTVMSSQLKLYKSNSECGNIAIQTKNTIPRLGHRCLLIVKLVESLIRLGNGDIDMALLEADIVSCCIGLIFVYRLNSLLHLSVQRTLTMILENSDGRKSLQRSVLFGSSDFLKHLMSELRTSPINSTGGDKMKDSEYVNNNEHAKILSGTRSPLVGHLVQIAHSIKAAQISAEPANNLSTITTADKSITTSVANIDLDEENNQMEDTADIKISPEKSDTNVRLLFVECGASEEWDEFVNNVLQPILDMQSNFQVELDGNQEDFKTHFFETHVDADLPAFGTFAVSTKQVNIGESIWSRSQITITGAVEGHQHSKPLNDDIYDDKIDDDDDDDWNNGVMNGSMANVSDSFADFAAIETQTGFSSQFGAFADFDSINQFESKTEIFKNLFDSNTNFDFEFKIDDDEKIFSDFGPSTFDDFSETTITDPIILTEPQANKATLVGNNSELSSHPSEVRVNDAGSSGTHSEMTASWVSNGQSNSLESEISTPKPLSSSVQDSSLQKSLEPSSSSNGRNSPTSSPTTSLSSSGSITSPESESASESSVPEGITANVSPESTLKPPLTANGNSPIFLSSTNSSGAKISAAFEDLEF